MCTLENQIKICSKHHLYCSDAMKLMGASYKKFKPVWEKMVNDFESITGKKFLISWGLPTSYVLDYLNIDFDKILKAYEQEKRLA